MPAALVTAERRIRAAIAADRKADARRALADMARRPDRWLVNDWRPGVMLVEPVHPIHRPRRPLPLARLTIPAARAGLRHLRSTSRGTIADHSRQAAQLAAILYARRLAAPASLRKAA